MSSEFQAKNKNKNNKTPLWGQISLNVYLTEPICSSPWTANDGLADRTESRPPVHWSRRRGRGDLVDALDISTLVFKSGTSVRMSVRPRTVA